MYRINGTNQNGERLIPVTDEDYLHPEDIQKDWVFIPSAIELNEMIDLEMFTLGEYLIALDSPRLLEMYKTDTLRVQYEGLANATIGLAKFFMIDPLNVAGTLQAISSKGIYITWRGNPNVPLPESRDLSGIAKASMRYIRNQDWKGMNRIISWVIHPDSTMQEE